ncbi:hypothetical protein FNV43_RR16365 [Rhamnella rubrinervis]|uniref:Glutamate receptor n=1 Tax=Rhamnella rubrinervis TaxID=2594499 RepID=A0A8K0GYN4_9ROSA|nr:hypothetical protein FNV43_RR16365 [Rhamnella rubrinervis]
MKDNEHVVGIVGAIVDHTSRIGKEEKVAMRMAMEDFYSITNQTLILHIIDSQRDPMHAALGAKDLITRQQAQAILGPQTWEGTSLVAKVGSENRVPVLSFADDTPKWATEVWPFLVQASAANTFYQMKAVAAIVQDSSEWFRVTVIYDDSDSSINEVLPQLSSALREVGTEIHNLVPLPPFVSFSELSEELERLKNDQTRVFVVHLSVPLALRFFEKARELNMMEKDYVWITTDPFTSLVHSFNASTISSMQGVVGVKRYFPEDGPRFRDFYYRFRKRFSSEHPEEDHYEPGVFAVQSYDAAWTVALAMNQSSKLLDGQNLLSKILQSKFDGLSGKVEFNTTVDQKLPPAQVFQIVNVVGKSYRELGFWSEQSGFTASLGENAKNSSSMEVLGQVFWPGAPRLTPKGWTTTSSNNKPLRIGVPSLSNFKQYVNVEEDYDSPNNLSFSGFAIDVFKATLEELPYDFPYDFFPFNGTYDSLVEQIHLKKYDAIVGDVAIVARRYRHAEFTLPYIESALTMVVTVQPETRNRAWLFMKPFTKSMWVLIALVNVYNGFVVWFIERNHCPELKGSVLNQIGILLWLAFSTLFSLHGDKLHSNLSRMAMVVWLFMALVITQTYTANLASMLTLQRLEPTFSDIGVLRSSSAKIGYCRGSFVQRYLNEVLRFNLNNIKNFSSPDDYAKALRNKEIAAAFLEVPMAKLFLAKYCKGFIRVGPTYKVGGFGYVFPKGSPMLASVNEALLKVFESGKLRELEQGMLASEKCEGMEDGDDETTQSLSPNSFFVPFIITGATSTIALVFYLCRVYKSMFGHKNLIWRLEMAVIKGRFSRRASGLPETGTNIISATLNSSDSNSNILV